MTCKNSSVFCCYCLLFIEVSLLTKNQQSHMQSDHLGFAFALYWFWFCSVCLSRDARGQFGGGKRWRTTRRWPIFASTNVSENQQRKPVTKHAIRFSISNHFKALNCQFLFQGRFLLKKGVFDNVSHTFCK